MKKTIIATLVILAIASTSIFALTPTDNFKVKTTISEVGLIQVTKTALAANSTAFPSGSRLEEYGVLGNESVKTIGYLSTISNNRNGYTVTMTATAMESKNTSGAKTYINYTIGCDVANVSANSITTNSNAVAGPPVEVLSVGPLNVITSSSKPVTITINTTDYAQAVTGDYEGTVKFSFVSNT